MTTTAPAPSKKKKSTISQTRAKQLINAIRDGLLNVEKNIVEFIHAKGWLALGYPTFNDCWNIELVGIRLASHVLKAEIVFQLVDEGLDKKEIVELTGIGDYAVEQLIDQHALNVWPTHVTIAPVRKKLSGPPSVPGKVVQPNIAPENDHGTVPVRPYSRSLAGPRVNLELQFTPEQIVQMTNLAEQHQFDLKEIAAEAVWNHLSDIASGAITVTPRP